MKKHKPLWRQLKKRLNPKLHPLLAVGIGLGFVALFLPGGGPRPERHSDAEILERLTANRIDPDHGPLFWLAEQRRDTELYAQALARCAAPLTRLQPSCLAILHLDELTRTRQGDYQPWAAFPDLPPEPPPVPQESP